MKKIEEKLVICEKLSNLCPHNCPHSKRHKPIDDCYGFDENGKELWDKCNIIKSECGYLKIEETICK